MVLKASKGGFNTGNTIRKKLLNNYERVTRRKGIQISNLRYYGGVPSCAHILAKLENQAHVYECSDKYKCYEILEIKHWIKYFCERNEEISDGLFDRDYIETGCEDYTEELISAIQLLISYQGSIKSGNIDLGLGPEDAISITITVYEHGDLTDIGRKRYTFDSRVNQISENENRKICIEERRKNWHNQHMRAVQRPANIASRFKYDEQVDGLTDTRFGHDVEIAITIEKHENPAASSSLHKLIHKMYTDGPKPKNHKSFKKSHHQKVKQYSYHHNNLHRDDVAEVTTMILNARSKYRRIKTNKLAIAEKKYRRAGKVPPWLPVPSKFYIPVGLWPDDAKVIQKKYDNFLAETQEERNNILLKQQKDFEERRKLKARLKDKNKTSMNIVNDSVTDAFLTHVAFADDEFTSGIEKQRQHNFTLSKPKVKRVTRSLDMWEFVDDLLYHIKDGQKVVLTNCQISANTPRPPAQSKDRKQSVTSSCNDSVMGLSLFEVESANVMSKQTVKSATSQSENSSEKMDLTKPVPMEKSVNTKNPSTSQVKKRKNGRKRKKEKLKIMPQKLNSDKPATLKRQETIISVGGVEKNIAVIPIPKMVHTKDNTQLFLENFSDFRFPGIVLKLKSSNLKPSFLIRKFGNNYQEASLFPRVFSIDVTDKLMDILTLFRKPDEPFCKPFASLVVQLDHADGAEISKENSLSFTMATLLLKADMEMACFEDFYNRMQEKLKYHLIYPLTKIVEDFIQIYKTLPYTSYMMPKIIPEPSLKAAERVRSQLDWLYTLLHWKFEIHPAIDAYTIFSQSFQAFNIPRPTTSSLCRIIDSTPNIALRSCDIPSCYHTPLLQFLSCQHAMCKVCLQECLIQDMCERNVPLCCWVPGCKNVIDPVSLLFLMSLPLYKLQQAYLEDKRIESHPLWQWCPRTGCGRVVKLSGAGFLDNGVVIVCDCGEVWCFHCRQEGHWPASCSQAKTYAYLRKQDSVEAYKTKYLMKCPVTRVLCKKCSLGSGDNMFSTNQGTEQTDGDSLLLSQNLQCECQYEVCKRCVNSEDSTIAVPKSLLDEGDEGWTPDSSKSLLLPLLYYNNAILHRKERELWSWSSVEIRTSKILQQIKKSKSRVASSHTGTNRVREVSTTCSYLSTTGDRESSMGGSPFMSENTSILHLPRTRTFHRPKTGFTTLPSTGDSEKFFLITLQQFVNQAHVLLEYVYVYLMSPESTQKVPNVLPLVIKLESTAKQINQILCTLRFSSTSTLTKLQKLLEAGNKVVVAITTTFKNMNVHGINKQPTFFKTDFTKLPPIGQKIVQFADINDKTF